MMKQFVQCVTCVAALMSAPVVSMAQTQNTYAENQITFQGTVEAIDYQFRTVTVRGPEGNLVALDVPSSATRFSEIKVAWDPANPLSGTAPSIRDLSIHAGQDEGAACVA